MPIGAGPLQQGTDRLYDLFGLFGSFLIRFDLFYLGPVRYDKARIDDMVFFFFFFLVARCASNCLANYSNFSTFGGQYSEGIQSDGQIRAKHCFLSLI